MHKHLSQAKPSASTKAVNYQQQSYTLVLQSHQGDAALMMLNKLHWKWLEGLKNSYTLGQLCALKSTELEPLMTQVTYWITLGCIDGFSVSRHPQTLPTPL